MNFKVTILDITMKQFLQFCRLFCGSFISFSVLCLLCLCARVYMCLVVTCWERADLLALVCGV